jgi:hypothetical protein
VDVLLVVTLAVNIALLARHRFFTPGRSTAGGLTEGTPRAGIAVDFAEHVEQMVLALAVHLVWAATMPREWQSAIRSRPRCFSSAASCSGAAMRAERQPGRWALR